MDALLEGMGDVRPGLQLGPYELLAPVGRGGMAVVWAARRTGAVDGAPIAIKTMLPALLADARYGKMFLAEAKLASSLHHPHVCEVVDAGETGEVLWLAMEWLEGDTLAAVMSARAPIPPAAAALIALDVALGLHAAHAATGDDGTLLGVVHRDVSPQNILVGVDGTAKITDFGIAKVEGAPATQAGYLKGKVRYMAPEQVYCEAVDRRTDVFALGVVLYEATTGRHPFAGATDLATLSSLASPEEATPPSEIAADYPAELEDVVLRAIAKQPSQRYASCEEMAEAIRRAMSATGGADAARTAVATLVRDACGASIAARERAIESAHESLAPRAPEDRARAATRSVSSRLLLGGAAVAVAAVVGLAVASSTRRSEEPRVDAEAATASEPERRDVPARPVSPVASHPTLPDAAPQPSAATPPRPTGPGSKRGAPAAGGPGPSAEPSAPSVPQATSAPTPGVLETRE
jgi:serine/threonine-protein kinase